MVVIVLVVVVVVMVLVSPGSRGGRGCLGCGRGGRRSDLTLFLDLRWPLAEYALDAKPKHEYSYNDRSLRSFECVFLSGLRC